MSVAHRRASRPVLVLLQLLVFVTYIFGPTAAFAEEPTPEPTPTESVAPDPTTDPTPAPTTEPTAPPASSEPTAEPIAAPTISSDKGDYAPGELVTLTGSNWQPGEQVYISVEDDQGSSWRRDALVTADAFGTVTDSFYLPSWFVALYKVTAAGTVSGTATTTFTDANLKVKGGFTGGVNPNGDTAVLTFTRFSGLACSGTPRSQDPDTLTLNTSDKTVPPASQNSVSLSAAATSAGGRSFVNWTDPSGSVVSTTATWCADFPASGTDKTYVANYSATATTTTSISSDLNPSIYGDEVTFTATISPSPSGAGTVTFKNGSDTLCAGESVTVNVATCSTSDLAVGSHGITAEYSGASGFAASTSDELTQDVDAATLSVDAVDDSKTYGDADPTFTYTLSGFVNGEDETSAGVSGTALCSRSNPLVEDAGSYTDVISCDPNDLAAANYVFVTGDSADFTIDAADQTIEFSEPTTPATYGETFSVNPTASSGLPVSLSASGGCSVTTLTPPLVGWDVTMTSGTLDCVLTASQAGNANYNAATSVERIVEAAPADLDISVDDETITYGDATPTFTLSYDSFVLDDDATDLGGSPVFTFAGTGLTSYGASTTAPTNVGTYSVTPSGLTSSNYAITFTAGDFTIDAATLSVDAVDDSKTYGDADPTFTYTLSGFVNGEDETSAGVSGTALCSRSNPLVEDAGSYTDVISCDPNDLAAANYVFVTGDSADFTIDAATLSVDAVDDSKTYGDADPTFTYTLSGFVNGEDETSAGVSGTALCSRSNPLVEDAGSYTDVISCDPNDLAAANYVFVTGDSADFTIDAATLSVDAVDDSKTYGDADPTFTYTLSGFVNGEDETSAGVSGTALCSRSNPLVEDAGSYTDVISCDPNDLAAANYVFVTGDSADFTINQADLDISVSDETITYGDATPTFTVSYDSFVAGDEATDLGGTLVLTFAGTGSTIYAASAVAPTGAGTYSVTPSGLTSSNYAITFAAGTFTIEEKDLTVDAVADSKTYGADDPAFAWTYSGFITGEDATNVIITGSAECTRDPGETVVGSPYEITCAPGDLLADNYSFVTGAGADFTINQADLDISVDDETITYGDSPTFTIGYDSFVAGDDATDLAGTLVLTFAGTGSTVYAASTVAPTGAGTYSVTPSGLTSSNYAITFAAGTFTIEKASLTITASSPATIIVGSPKPTIVPIYSGFVSGDNASNSLTTLPVCGTAYTTASPVGTYTTSCSGAVAPNYTISYAGGAFNVIFAWGGFLQPINDTAHQIGLAESKFKLGQTIPVKFELRNAAGAIVQQTPNPTFTRSGNLGTCDVSTAPEALPTLAPDATNQYAWQGGQYHYNWSTKGLTAGEYRIYANLADGTRKYVDICLQK